MSLITCIQNLALLKHTEKQSTDTQAQNNNHDSQHLLKKPFSSIVCLVLAAVSTATGELCPLLCTWLWVTIELFCGEKDGSMLAALSWLCWNREITPWATFRKASFTPIQEKVSNTKCRWLSSDPPSPTLCKKSGDQSLVYQIMWQQDEEWWCGLVKI